MTRRDLRVVDLICECDCWCVTSVYFGPVDQRPDPVPSCEACKDGEHVSAPDDDSYGDARYQEAP